MVRSDCSAGEYRNFFQFSIPTLGGIVESARLLLETSNVLAEQGPTMDLTLTSISDLTFADLGTGAVYATRTYSAGDADTVVSIDLNAAALADIAADAGGILTISGRITSGATFGPSLPDQLIFGRSENNINHLEITAVPESDTLLLLGSGLAGLALFRARRGTLRRVS